MKKDFLILGFVVLLAAFLLGGGKIQSAEDYYQTHIEDIREDSEVVTLSIRCDTVLENYDSLKKELQDEKYVPADGVILETTKYVLRPGDTAFDLLCRAVRHEKIQMEYQGADKNAYNSVYIQGIHYLYEFSCGELSGWMYRVNGKFPKCGCSSYELKNGDAVEFVYTCDLGRDIGGDFSKGNNNAQREVNGKEEAP